MNSWIRRAVAVDDSPKVRIVVAFLVAILVWLVFLVELGHWLGTATPAPPPDKPLEMRVVEFDPPTPPSPPIPTASIAPAQPASPKSPQSSHPRSRTVPQRSTPPTPPKPDVQLTHNVTPVQPGPESAEAKPAAQPSARVAPSGENATPPAAPSGDSAARSIAQPLPELSDDLREQAYQTVATARFAIHADGSVDVELIKPTPSPRLNQILLEALRKWRFFPAMQAGHPVESRQDIRVHFNVS